MKSLRIVALAVCALLWAINPSLAGFVAAWLALFVLWHLLSSPVPRARCFITTLTVSEILTDVLDAFKQRVPALNFFSTDMSQERVKYGQTIIAHLPVVPTAYDHVAANGYSANAQNARDLLVDVPIVMDGWKDVPIKILVADATQDRSQNYLKTISNAGYVLGKAVVDYALTKVVSANFSQSTDELTASAGRDTLSKVRVAMNTKKAGTPRYMLTNSDLFASLDNDPRVASRDYYGQQTGSDPFGRLINISGFAEVQEYPDFPENSHGLSAFAFDSRAIAVATRLPLDSTELAQQLNIPVTYSHEVVQDPQTGLAIAGFAWIDSNTHNIYVTSTVMYGAVAGSQAGSAGDKTDYAGHRVVNQ